MKDRALSTIGLWVVVGLILYVFGKYDAAQLGGFLLILSLGLAAQYEVYRILEKTGATPRIGLGLFAGGALMTAVFLGFVQITPIANYVALAWVGVLLSLLARPLENRAWVLRFSTAFGVLYVPFLLCFLVDFAKWQTLGTQFGLWLALWAVATTKFTDVGGLLIGTPFGRHKIAPNVSPAKSWEGCAGGVVFSMLVGVGGAAAMNQWLPGFHFNLLSAALCSIPLAALSVPSDLVESYLKRRADVKDSGATIPGIGGALDLIDSLLLVAPVAYLLLHGLTKVNVG
jgi:phosphatidate cytidylyltransferase